MKILITGIGCIGKSSLRERIAAEFPDQMITVDMDYAEEIPSDKDKIVIVESIHGLEENPQQFDRILYLLPPRLHVFLWLRRAWAWFSTGIVDLSFPRGRKKRYSILNIPIILKVFLRNVILSNKWIRSDLQYIYNHLISITTIAHSFDEGLNILRCWHSNDTY